MAQPTAQFSFNSGEWAPNLYARVDIDKYHSGAALLRNFFVDYRGGASTRTGTKYVLNALSPNLAVRLIPFQASFDIGYILEFGQGYIRPYRNGSPILEAALSITGITQANPAVVSVVNSYTVGNWVYISGVSGMTQVNGNYYVISAQTGTSITLQDLYGNPVNSSTFGAYTGGGTVQRVYTIGTGYNAPDLAKLKFALNVNTMIICHPSYQPAVLTVVNDTTWTLLNITFGTTVTTPTGVGVGSTEAAGQVYYSYVVTAVDVNGQESAASSPANIGPIVSIATTPGSNGIYWNAVSGAVSYNVYKAVPVYSSPVPIGADYGFIGNTSAVNFYDSNITADFSQGPPVIKNPFTTGTGVTWVNITTVGSYTTAPTVTFDPPGGGGTTATGSVIMYVNSATVVAGGTGYSVGDTITFLNGTVLTVLTLSGSAVATVSIYNGGQWSGALPANPQSQVSTNHVGTGATFNFTWGVFEISISNNGSGYTTVPLVHFSAGTAAGTAVLGAVGVGNPSVPAFFQQRLVLAAPAANPQTLYFSQTASYYNFNVSSPIEADDAITATLISGQLNHVRAMLPQPSGLIVLSDGGSWLINGGSFGAAISPSSIVANAQSFVGANDVPPIIVNYDVLYVQAKGASVRDASYNFYANVFTGAEVSIISSHLFYGHQVNEWAWAEEPFKVVWAVRDDGILLSMTFIKEQDFMAWAHHDTQGSFTSVATVIENVAGIGYVNAVYAVVQRTVQGQIQKYIERFEERIFPNGVKDAWCVDAGIQYSGTPATTFSGAVHLAGLTVTGLADGVVIPPFTMPANGTFTLGTAASKVTVGLAYVPQLQTLILDTKESPTVQGKQKKINAVTARVVDTLGLSAGSNSSNLVPMKDLVIGNVGSLTNTVVSGLVSGDVRIYLDPAWTEQGQYFFQQNNPMPATILGVFPQVAIGDTPK